MSIIKNAVESIQIGMEDYHSDDSRRMLSAIRNIYAGVLLIYKQKLNTLSPEGDGSLLRVKLKPVLLDGKVVWRGEGKNTVDKRDIRERFKSLGVGNVDWELLDKLSNIRNDVEHYFSDVPVSQMKETVAGALRLLTEFCEPQLGQKPQDLLGVQCWEMMLDVASFHAAELKRCREKLSAVKWKYETVADSLDCMRCCYCDSQLIEPANDGQSEPNFAFICMDCQQQSDYGEVVGGAVALSLAYLNYQREKEGLPWASDQCPRCGELAYVHAEDACMACHFEFGEYKHCDVCGTPLDAEEAWAGPLCSYHRHKIQSGDD